MTKRAYVARPLGEANARAQRAQAVREAQILQRYWREEERQHHVVVWATYDDVEKRYVVKSNLINGAPPPVNKNLRR
jgi:hypothetical protein